MNIHNAFIHEYDVSSLISVTPRGQDFSLLVTPRYHGHYHEVEYEAFTSRYLKAILPHADIFVDVGAHYGFFSLLAAAANEHLRIISVEPVAETRDVLIKNLEAFSARRRDTPRFTVCDKAISDESGVRPFNISLSSDSCSFYPHPNAAPIRQVAVETTSVDALLSEFEPVSLVIKINTDGHEGAVLRGMGETFNRFENVTLVVEINPKMLALAGARPEQLLAQIETLGFAAFIVDEERGQSFRISPRSDWAHFVQSGGYANLICVRKARALSICFFGHCTGATGAERTLADLVKDLVGQHGAFCTVVVPQPGPLETLIRDAGASCFVAPYAWWCYPPHESDGGAAALNDALSGSLVSSVRDLVPLVADIDPDVICTQTVVIPWGAAVAAVLGKPHIWSVCEYGELDHGLRFVPSFRDVAADIERCSDFIFFCAKDIKISLFPSLTDDRSDVLYRYIEVHSPWGMAKLAPTSPRPLQLAIFGTVAPPKGQADAIGAVALLKSRGLAIELTVVGRGDPGHLAELRRRVSELELTNEVRFVDFLMNPIPLMSQADVVLVCSRREAFGRVAAEAMLLGKPVVYAAAGGIAEYMRDGETGLGYPPGDTTALADRIQTLLRDEALRAHLGAAAQAYARTAFTRDEFSGKFYRKALELRGASARAQFPTSLLPVLQRQLNASAELVETLERKKAELQESLSGAERRLTDSGATLDQRTALLSEAQRRISAVLTEAQGRVAAAEADSASAERGRAAMRVVLDERTAQLADAQREIAALARSVAEVESRFAVLGERAAVLGETQARIAALEASAKEAEQRVAELGAALGQTTAELTEARERSAALAAAFAERERELARYKQRFASIKASLSWRLMAPFREMYRPIRRLQASRLGVNLSAAWHHPRDSHKRKLYRVKHMPRPPLPTPRRRPSKFAAKLRALARYPFSPKRRKAYREQLRSIRFPTQAMPDLALSPLTVEPRTAAHEPVPMQGRASRLGVKLRAFWRYPTSSAQRKAYRASRMSAHRAAEASAQRRQAKLSAKLLALARSPASTEQYTPQSAPDHPSLRPEPEATVSRQAAPLVQFGPGAPVSPDVLRRCAIHVHIFYADLVNEIVSYLNRGVTGSIDVFVTVTDPQVLTLVRDRLGSPARRITVDLVPNRGRDLGPLFTHLRHLFRNYAYVCHLHSKKSPHVSFGDNWRRYLFNGCIGDDERVNNILGYFEAHPDCGIIYPENFLEVRHAIPTERNIDRINYLLRRLDPSWAFRGVDFPAGSMCWFRTDCFRQVIDRLPDILEYEDEGGKIDGTTAHALERCLTLIPNLAGYEHRVIAGARTPMEVVRNSFLFDAESYKSKHLGAGSDIDPVRHYLTEGARAGLDPGPLFDTRGYLKRYPDVAAVGMNPLVHYVAGGCYQGRLGWDVSRAKELQAAYLFDPSAALARIRDATSGYEPPSLRPGDNAYVLVSSLGNTFFVHMQHMLCAALRQLGVNAIPAAENDDLPRGGGHKIIVAPHEFYYLGRARYFGHGQPYEDAILINTEQLHTPWFARALPYLERARHVLDINLPTAACLSSLGVPTRFLPLGYVEGCEEFFDGSALLDEPPMAALASARFPPTPPPCGSLADRPIDLLFVGSISSRREAFFAEHATRFAQSTCFLHLADASAPARSAAAVSPRAFSSLARRAKLLLNVHQGEMTYFEWHRIVMFGFWQGAAVVTERSSRVPHFDPGAHYLEADLNELPEMIEWLLHSSDGRREADRVAKAGYEALRASYSLTSSLAELFQARDRG